MPQFPPTIANLSSPRIRSWIPPRIIKVVGARYEGKIIYLPTVPSVWYEAYNWSTGAFGNVGYTPAYSSTLLGDSTGPYEPVRVQIEGTVTVDKTNYSTVDTPTLSEYGVTRRIEYYLNGDKIITNIDLDTLNLNTDSIVVTYTVTCDKLRLIIDLWQDSINETGKGVSVDYYSLSLFEEIHPSYG